MILSFHSKILTIIILFSVFFYNCVLVDAQINDEYPNDNWSSPYKLYIQKYQENKTISANGEDKAEMIIVIRNKITNQLSKAPFDLEILLKSENCIVKPQKVTILEDQTTSDEIILTSTQSGIAIVTAEAVGFESINTHVEFTPPGKPAELYIVAIPNESIVADGRKTMKLRVMLVKQDGELFKPQKSEFVDITTNRGERLPQMEISKNMPYGEEYYQTYEEGYVIFLAKSIYFKLESETMASFISPINCLTTFLALLGGLLGGIIKYYQEHKKGYPLFPKKQENKYLRLGLLGHFILHAIFGLLMYIGACFNMPLTNLFELPVSVNYGVFMIGLTGGLFFFAVILLWGSLWGLRPNKNHNVGENVGK